MKIIQPVILCGGSGTRLWPLSTAQQPKQLVRVGDRTLLQRTTDRLSTLQARSRQTIVPPLLVMNQEHTDEYPFRVLYEPYGNDTAVATLRAALAAEDDSYLLVLPADHYLSNQDSFVQDILKGLDQVEPNNIVLFGLSPTSPETKYGYIYCEKEKIRFHEKPSLVEALQYIEGGAVWNSGIFLASTRLLRSLLHPFSDWIDYPRPGRAPSFDVAVLQNYETIHLCYGQGWGWSDVGTWDSFLTLPEIIQEMRQTDCYTAESEQLRVLRRSSGKMVILGCNNLIVIQDGQNVLIMNSQNDYSPTLKRIVQEEMTGQNT